MAGAEALLEASAFEPERLPQAMEQAGRLLGFNYFCLVSFDLERPAFIASDEQKAGIAAYFSGGWAEVDYRARTAPDHPLGTIYLDHRVVSVEERARSAIYNEFYRPLNMSHHAGIRFDFAGEEWFCAASRSESKGEIDGLEADAFTQLAGTAIRAASLAARLHETRASGMLEGLATTETAAVILNREGHVSAVTSAAERVFGADFGVRDRLLWSANAEDATALARLALATRRNETQLHQKTLLIRGRGRTHPVLLTASPVLGAGLDEMPGARMLLVLSDLGRRDTARVSELCELFDLTPAEAEVAALIAQGLEVSDIAARRNVAASTIRVQMKTIFRKMGVNRQVDLVQILARLKI